MSVENKEKAELNCEPLVSVGVPTFERPDGLRRTLSHLVAQTYRRLEIVVSDNASSNPDVERVIAEFTSRDSRIRYFRQEHNLGAMANFKFVLAQATGEYFMWAADDDEWSPEFVEKCLRESIAGESVACHFDTLFRASRRREANRMPSLDPAVGAFSNVKEFLACMQPSIIYGLHPRASLRYFFDIPVFDFVDCYFVLRQILGPGVRVIPETLYVAGVDAPTYQIKANGEGGRLDYAPFFLRSMALVCLARTLSFKEKLAVIKEIRSSIYGLIRHHERSSNPSGFLMTQIKRCLLRCIGLRFHYQ